MDCSRVSGVASSWEDLGFRDALILCSSLAALLTDAGMHTAPVHFGASLSGLAGESSLVFRAPQGPKPSLEVGCQRAGQEPSSGRFPGPIVWRRKPEGKGGAATAKGAVRARRTAGWA